MSTPFAINGMGRIGRALTRIALDREELELVAVNDLVPASGLARLLARDTLHGPLGRPVASGETPDGGRPEPALVLDGRSIPVFAEADPARIPWEGTGARIVVESSGRFTGREQAAAHLRGSVGKVVVSAPGREMDLTICLGANEHLYDRERHHVLSNASCTTNCLAPVVRVLDESFGVVRALFATVHCYTNSQHLTDAGHPDPRRARAAALNMIPTTTSAEQAIAEVLPHLAGRLAGYAVRVPVPDVSLVDLVAELESRPSAEQVREAFLAVAAGERASILSVCEEELVSSDFLGDPHSAIVDLPLVQAVDGALVRVVAWYDNEWGYASRLADLLAMMGGSL